MGIYLYTVELMLTVAFGNKYVGSSAAIDIYLYVVQRVLSVAFGSQVYWFESHNRHISLCI
jgi:hypothetical protein